MRKRFFLFLISYLLIFSSCLCQNDNNLFPELEDWKTDSIRTYNPDNLWDIINGAADNYIKFDFQELQMTDYKGSNGNYITLETYKHRTPAHAFGIYVQERPSKWIDVGIGAQGYSEPSILNLFNSQYYIKMRTHDTSDETMETMKLLAKKVSDNISDSPSFPKELSFFPKKGRIENSEQFISRNFLGFSYLHSVFTAKYKLDDQSFTLFIIKLNSKEEVREMLLKYSEFCGIELQSENEGKQIFTDKYNGDIPVEWKNNYIWGILELNSEELQNNYLSMIKSLIFAE